MSNIAKIWVKNERLRLKSSIRLYDYILSQYHALYGDEISNKAVEINYKNYLVSRELLIKELEDLKKWY